MIKVSEEIKKEIFNDCKNTWLDRLFYILPYWYPDISFEEQKETFFSLVKDFLDEGLIKFHTPTKAEPANHLGFWDTDSNTIVQYLRDNFPQHTTDENDMDVNLYFFVTAPTARWLQEDGGYGYFVAGDGIEQ